MWTQYSREKAAKPGAALIAMIIAFGATVGLAQWTIGHRSIQDVISPPGWPIKFTLPKSHRWIELPSREYRGYIEDADESKAFRGRSETDQRCMLIVAYAEGPQAINPVGALSRSVLILTGVVETIRMGPLKGTVTTFRDTHEGITQLHAEASNDKDLQIRVYLWSEQSSRRMMEPLTALCESIELTRTEKSPK